MIIDTLAHFEDYVKMHPLFEEVAKFLRSNRLAEMPEGIYPVKGDDVTVNVQIQNGKTRDEASLEAHRRMIDIQVPISADETYGVSPLENLSETDFDEERDCGLWHGTAAENYVTCTPDMFVVFFPQDAHAPLITPAAKLKKAVFKVKV